MAGKQEPKETVEVSLKSGDTYVSVGKNVIFKGGIPTGANVTVTDGDATVKGDITAGANVTVTDGDATVKGDIVGGYLTGSDLVDRKTRVTVTDGTLHIRGNVLLTKDEAGEGVELTAKCSETRTSGNVLGSQPKINITGDCSWTRIISDDSVAVNGTVSNSSINTTQFGSLTTGDVKETFISAEQGIIHTGNVNHSTITVKQGFINVGNVDHHSAINLATGHITTCNVSGKSSINLTVDGSLTTLGVSDRSRIIAPDCLVNAGNVSSDSIIVDVESTKLAKAQEQAKEAGARFAAALESQPQTDGLSAPSLTTGLQASKKIAAK